MNSAFSVNDFKNLALLAGVFSFFWNMFVHFEKKVIERQTCQLSSFRRCINDTIITPRIMGPFVELIKNMVMEGANHSHLHDTQTVIAQIRKYIQILYLLNSGLAKDMDSLLEQFEDQATCLLFDIVRNKNKQENLDQLATVNLYVFMKISAYCTVIVENITIEQLNNFAKHGSIMPNLFRNDKDAVKNPFASYLCNI